MNTANAIEIEGYLLDARRWVPAAEICARFAVRERLLRSDGDRLGLCSAFAISGDQGYKHVAVATEAEVDHFYARLRRHGLAELVTARRLKRRRREVLAVIPRPPAVVEKDTGQVLLFTDRPLPGVLP